MLTQSQKQAIVEKLARIEELSRNLGGAGSPMYGKDSLDDEDADYNYMAGMLDSVIARQESAR